MAKAPTEIRSLARSHTEKALNVLVGVMECDTAPAAARVSAACAVLDRGWGKPTQPIAGDDEHGAIRFNDVTDHDRAKAIAALLAKTDDGN